MARSTTGTTSTPGVARSRRRTTKAASAKAETSAPPEPDKPLIKQAVVVVHGIGEQRPLQTLREFVEAVYQRDHELTPDDDPRLIVEGVTPKVNRVWVVPDPSAGSNELRRITTPEHIDNRRTDFYEFYWADVMNGTPIEMVVAWIRGLLLRSPLLMPKDIRVWIAWALLWVITAVFVAGAIFTANPDLAPFKGAVTFLANGIRGNHAAIGQILIALSLVILGYRLATTKPIDDTKLLMPILLQVAGQVVLWFSETDAFSEPRVWAGLLTLAVGSLMGAIIGPYLGDIVRYVRATPATIAAREEIRNRGLQLLREIHGKTNSEGEREYGRIILVGHSLGCFVAYDLLQLYWYEAGPNPKNFPMTPEVQAALTDLDMFVAAQNPQDGGPGHFEFHAYRKAQDVLRKALLAAGQGWLISDFVTLGSPIVHSEFLIADHDRDLERSLSERMLSTSPPRPDPPNNSMLYDAGGHAYPHHAAVFSAVRWSNIYDYAWLPLLGDVISGKAPERYGPGVKNHPIKVERRSRLFRRFFTHTAYWTDTNGRWDAPHIQELRKVLALSGEESETPPEGGVR